MLEEALQRLKLKARWKTKKKTFKVMEIQLTSFAEITILDHGFKSLMSATAVLFLLNMLVQMDVPVKDIKITLELQNSNRTVRILITL